MVERTRALTVRMSDREVAMLKELAEADGLSVSDYVRLYVRRLHREAFGAPKTKKRKR